MKNVQIIITGKVYKTGFRYFVKQMADVNKITGFVKYDENNSISIEAEGEEDNLKQFMKFCSQGCASSEIADVNIEPGELHNYNSFEIRNNRRNYSY